MSSQALFYTTVDREDIWHAYLEGFTDPIIRQEHTCNACKSFIRQFGGIVTLNDERKVSLWEEFDVASVYVKPLSNLAAYVQSQPVTDVFVHTERQCGIAKNVDRSRSITWNHFALTLPTQVVRTDVDVYCGEVRTNKQVLQRSLEELSVEATMAVLGLISDNVLYRGIEHKGLLQSFLALQQAYAMSTGREHFCWTHAVRGGVVTRIRNTAIGTLLVDLSEGVDLEAAVAKYERVVAPTNYKRPTALVTSAMVEQARATLERLELLDSLNRRTVTETDLDINNLLFIHKPTSRTDVLTEIVQEAIVSSRTFAKAQEIHITDFLTHVVPTAHMITVLLEPTHLDNFMTLVTAQDNTTPLLFKWDNPFSWSYTGGIADAIKERVKDAGGNVDGVLRVSLAWHNYDDLDLHVHEPDGNHIYYPRKRMRQLSSGMLDVDMNAGHGTTRTPVENIIWTDDRRMKEGTYVIKVHNFAQRETTQTGFTVQIACAGEQWEFDYVVNPRNAVYQDIITLHWTRQQGVRFHDYTTSRVIQRQRWGLRTAQFHQVHSLLVSPNHWKSNAIGNKHYFFILSGCETDEAPRPFYNEFLKPELEVHRKVFEIIGSKMPVIILPGQLSGLGFSETKRAQLIVQVQGNTRVKRVMKIIF